MNISSHLSIFSITIDLCAVFFVDSQNAGAHRPTAEGLDQITRDGLSDKGNSIKLDAVGNIYTTGRFSGTLDIGNRSEKLGSSRTGLNDTIVYKIDASANLVWAVKVRKPTTDWRYSIAVDTLGNVYTTGYFTSTVNIESGASALNIDAKGKDMFISKVDATGNFLWAVVMEGPYIGRSNPISLEDSGVSDQNNGNTLTA